MFFFEKKNQKTFTPSHPRVGSKVTKVFLLLFLQKKKTFLASFQRPPAWTR